GEARGAEPAPGPAQKEPPAVTAPQQGPAPDKGPPSSVERDLRGGIDAYEHRDYRKAQRLLARANTLCARVRDEQKACARLSPDITYHLGLVYEAEGQWAEAMAEYEKVLQRGDRAWG